MKVFMGKLLIMKPFMRDSIAAFDSRSRISESGWSLPTSLGPGEEPQCAIERGKVIAAERKEHGETGRRKTTYCKSRGGDYGSQAA